MKWYHFSVEYFEDLRNVNHCEFLIMRKKEDSGKYILENNLRTWSELKRERAAALKEKGEKEKETGKAVEKTEGRATPLSPIPKRKQWGGCPNGCNHQKTYSTKVDRISSQLSLQSSSNKQAAAAESLVNRRPAGRRWQSSDEEEADDPRGRVGPPKVDVQKSLEDQKLDDMMSSPDGTPSFISVEDRLRNRLKSPSGLPHLRVGRDFGGSASGHTSQAGSDTENSTEDDKKGKSVEKKIVLVQTRMEKIEIENRRNRELSGMGRGAMADALGDQSDVGSDMGNDSGAEDLEASEKRDKSLRGSVY